MIPIAPASYHPIHRQNGSSSKQPRFNEVSPRNFFNSLFRFINIDIQDEPVYGVPARDIWLRRIWKLEPYLAGVLNSVTNIDKNRGWTITGGRNQVKRFVNILHNRFYYAPDIWGWRMAFGGSALSYYTSDLGSVTELGRQSKNGPIDSLYFVDPARCYLTGNFERPLRYTPEGSSTQDWSRDDYFRIASMPSTDEGFYGLGFCAVSRAIELAKIMIGIYQYDNEMLLNRSPRGLLLLKGITEQQWTDAMTSRDARLDGDEKRYYGAVNVLAALDPGVEIDAQLVALSSLPAEFDQQTFTDLLMYGYALVFGYDAREFWPVSSGSLGTATETEAQHRKGGAKGGLDFTLGWAEKINNEFPDTVLFEFEERDLDGELANAEVEQANADVVTTIYESGLKDGAPLITREEGRIMLADRRLIDPEWTDNEEDTIATDTDSEVGRSLDNERVQRAIWKYPDEPIVRYKFSVKNGRERHQYTTLVKPSRIKKRHFVVNRQFVKRQIESELEDYQEQIDDLAEQANEGEINQVEFDEALEALTIAILTLATLRGVDSGSESAQELIDAGLAVLNGNFAEVDVLINPALLQDALPAEVLEQLQIDINDSLTSTLSTDIFNGQYLDNPEGLLSRLTMWTTTALGLYYLGQVTGNLEQRYVWRVGPTEHCTDCARLNGQVHTGAEWLASGWRPQGRNLECNGYRCQCSLNATNAATSGGF